MVISRNNGHMTWPSSGQPESRPGPEVSRLWTEEHVEVRTSPFTQGTGMRPGCPPVSQRLENLTKRHTADSQLHTHLFKIQTACANLTIQIKLQGTVLI